MLDKLLQKFVKAPAGSEAYRSEVGSFTAKVGIAVNILLAFFKMLIGALNASVSILGDGINNLFDSISALVSWISFKIVARPADRKHPFGHARFEYISSSIVAMSILAVAILLFKASIQKILAPEPLEYSLWLVLIAVVSILVKLLLYFFYKQIAATIDSDLLVANAADSWSDIIATSAVLSALLISYFTDLNLDPYMGIAVAFLIGKVAFEILSQSYDHIMGKSPNPEKMQELQAKLESYEGILGAHDLIIHDYGPGKTYVTVHLEVDASTGIIQSHELIDRIERELAESEDIQITVHMDPLILDNPEQNRLHRAICQSVEEFNPQYYVRDFRLLQEESQCFVIFDLAVPLQDSMSNQDIKSRLTARLKQQFPDYGFKIVLSRNFCR